VTGTTRNGEAKVTVLNEMDCEGCDGSCGGSDSSFEMTADDPLGTGQGDRVKVEIDPRSFGKISFIVFGIPVLALMIGLGLGSWLSGSLFNGSYSNALQGGTAGFLFLISLVGVVGYDRYLAANSPNQAEIIEVLEGDYSCPDPGGKSDLDRV